MLCSNCYSRLRPVVAIDIDGTLADYHNHFINFATSYWGMSFPRDWDGCGNWEDYLCLTREKYRQTKLAYRQGGMKRSLPLYDEAAYFISQLYFGKVDVWIATTRPWQRLDNIDPDTQFWLERVGLRYEGLIYGEDKYEKLCMAVDHRRVVGVIDDLSANLASAQKQILPTFQVARPHNSGPGLNWFNRGTLNDALDWLIIQLKKWEAKNVEGANQ